MPVTVDQISQAVAQTQQMVVALEHNFQRPALVIKGGKPFFRHKNQDDLLLSYLKCVRAVSSLNACIVLLEHGYVQEIGALCRCIDDFNQDVLFLATPLGQDGPSEQQRRLVEEFFQEEFDDIDRPISASQTRNRVPRSKVLAGIARISGQPLNPNDAQEIHRTLQHAFSGYVHGAYVHIMEIYGGTSESLHYHLQGLRNTPRIDEWTEMLSSYVYRTMIAVEIVAKRCNNPDAKESIRQARHTFEGATGLGLDNPNKILNKMLHKLK